MVDCNDKALHGGLDCDLIKVGWDLGLIFLASSIAIDNPPRNKMYKRAYIQIGHKTNRLNATT